MALSTDAPLLQESLAFSSDFITKVLATHLQRQTKLVCMQPMHSAPDLDLNLHLLKSNMITKKKEKKKREKKTSNDHDHFLSFSTFFRGAAGKRTFTWYDGNFTPCIISTNSVRWALTGLWVFARQLKAFHLFITLGNRMAFPGTPKNKQSEDHPW